MAGNSKSCAVSKLQMNKLIVTTLDFEYLKILGSGGYGTVYLVSCINTEVKEYLNLP